MRPESSRVAVFQGPEKGFAIQPFPIPELREKEILVRIQLSTVCGSDLHTFQGHRPGAVPGALGHEITGTIVAFGPGSAQTDHAGEPLKEGDRITWLLYTWDPDDPLSLKGYPQKSAALFKYGHEAISPDDALHSGFADYLVIRKGTSVFRLPDTVTTVEAAPLNCGLATSMAAVRLAEPSAGQSALVSGCGLLGLYTCSILHSLGLREIIAVDPDEERLQKARLFGASKMLVSGDRIPAGIDLLIEMSGANQAMEKGIRALSTGGTAVLAGAVFHQPDFQVSGEMIVRNLLTIKGIHNYTPEDLLAAVHFIEKQRTGYPFASLVEEVFTLTHINEAFSYAITNRPVRIGIQPNE